jgi:hypothetical protein
MLNGRSDGQGHASIQWEAFQPLAEEASRAGRLDARARRLIHLSAEYCRGLGGATHSHGAQRQL